MKNLDVVMAGLLTAAFVLFAISMLPRTPSCHWQDLHTPAQTVDKAYYVTDPDGFSHTVTVQITRPAHVDKVCQ